MISEQCHQKMLFEMGRVEVAPKAPRVAELRLRRERANASEEELAVLLCLQPFRGCAQAEKGLRESQTPETKRAKVSACTPELGMKEARIKNGLSACIKHPNGDCPQPARQIQLMSDAEFLEAEPSKEPGNEAKGRVHEITQDWEPKSRYPDFWKVTEGKRERLERHEMGIAEAQCFRARKFAKRCGAFGKGKNIP